jgi:hypothetical protein
MLEEVTLGDWIVLSILVLLSLSPIVLHARSAWQRRRSSRSLSRYWAERHSRLDRSLFPSSGPSKREEELSRHVRELDRR